MESIEPVPPRGAGKPLPEEPVPVAGAVASPEEALEVGHMALVYTWALRAQALAGAAGRRAWQALHRGPGRQGRA
jgi:hypothetical protein